MKKIKYQTFSVLLFISLLITTFCTRNPEKITYKPVTLENCVEQFVSREVIKAYRNIKYHNKVFFTSYPNVCVADLDKKEVKILFKKGMGPNEVYWVNRLVRDKNEIFINSYWPLKHVYHFSPDAENINLQKLEIPAAISFDDFLFISPEQMVITYVGWKEGDLVRIYDLKTGKYQSMGKRTFTPIMDRFNVNIASICLLGDYIYAVQTIVPEIQVISVHDRKVVDKIELSPPFYIPMPPKYPVKKFDVKITREWMESWTSLLDISGKDPWLLITYIKGGGVGEKFYYELINTKDPSNRLIMDEIPYHIYDFEISGEKMHLGMCEEIEDGVRWLTADTKLY